MHHAFSAFVMILAGLLFTSCTATVVQQWATSRPAAAEYVPPPSPWDEKQRQALIPTKAGDECKPAPASEKPAPMVPRFSPLRRGPNS